MNTKSRSWEHIRDTKMKCRVHYFKSDLKYSVTDKVFKDVPTVAVILWNDDCRYIGVAQCSPKDSHSPEKGREIAAGRALKALLRHVEDPNTQPFGYGVEEAAPHRAVTLYGKVPDTIPGLDDKLMFDSEVAQ